MTLAGSQWEHKLLTLAEGPQNETPGFGLPARDAHSGKLATAYQQAEALTARHSRSFHLSSGLLPDNKRAGARALYAFCRVSDDLVDHGQGDVRAELESWRHRSLGAHPAVDDPIILAWTDARHRFGIPTHYAHQLLDGVGRDLTQSRYETFADLATYCYSVASTVGLMSMYVIGFQGQHAIPYAIKLGVALQMTNILRDIAEDYASGRVYLPQEELEAYNVGDQDLAAGVVTDRWRAFMRFQIDRNHRLYEESWPGIAMLHKSGRFAIGAAAELYRGILTDIEAHDYDVFSRRSHVSGFGKLRRLPRIWWRSRRQRAHGASRPGSWAKMAPGT